jgi:bla regulator protein BlaR1
MLLSFGIRFLSANLVITLLILIIITIKRLFRRHLSSRGQYNLWIPVLITLALPFIPLKSLGISPMHLWIYALQSAGSKSPLHTILTGTPSMNPAETGWIEDFSLSVSNNGNSLLPYVLIIIWIGGMLYVAGMILYTQLKIKNLLKSSLPVQHIEVRKIFDACKNEVGIQRNIVFKSSAFLKSPVTFGLLKPYIILPIHLISDFNETDIRFILLHELQHCKSKDILVNYTMSLFHILYWFHPLVWYTRKEMCSDREIACDTAVLHMLKEEQYSDYGFTLLNFTEKISKYPYSTVLNIGGTRTQIAKRIENIASYHKESHWLKLKSGVLFFLSAVLVLSCTPLFVADAASDTYRFTAANKSYVDFSSYFKDYQGSFVLYDLDSDSWEIYNQKYSTKRVSPDSTYKIYSALFGLETGAISPKDTLLYWNGDRYPFDAWNQNQTLKTAMQNSVNWYFETLDNRAGLSALNQYFTRLHYGNEDLSGGLSNFWMESSLKISPVEQVNLLRQLYLHELDFSNEDINAVKDSLLISSTDNITLYGKTGTGTIEQKDRNGWFIGFIETTSNTYFFAANIQKEEDANGKTASKIALEILEDKGLYIP